ncbi:MAG: hypothetical protein ABR555_09645, partial [Pyrinomonadaceae bacterium]
MEIKIQTPEQFSFKRTVISHGWYNLLPFELDRANWTLTRIISFDSGTPQTIRISASKRFIRITSERDLTKRRLAKVTRDVRHILRLDDNLDEFYKSTDMDPEFRWIALQGAGRLLRSPTVFEDLVKMICTTNCSWALTEKMVTGLVNNLGLETNDGRRAFPDPEAMAVMPLDFFVKQVRAGYRAPYL